jgi:outer membrane protein assembly factor BamB
MDLSGIRALPVIDNGRVYAIGGGGLLLELDLRSGRRLWEREVGGIQTPWLAGDWLYVQTLDQTLAAINRGDGRVRWLLDLPRYDDPEKKRDPLYWMGPVMAGGKLILAGSNQKAVSVDPVTGKQIGEIDLRDVISVPPVVASNTLLFVTDDGSIQAFR